MSDNEGFRADTVNEDSIRQIIAKVEGCDVNEVDLVRYLIEAGSEKGDNYMGDVAQVRATASSKGAKEKDYHWMIKLYKPKVNDSENFAKLLSVMTHEGRMYAEVFPQLASLLKPDSLIRPPRICDLVHWQNTPDQEMLVMDHMGSHGFRDPIDKKAGLDMAHCQLVLKWLATLHGLAHAMITKHPGGKDQWKKENPWSVPMTQDMPEVWRNLEATIKEGAFEKAMMAAEMVQLDSSRDYPGRYKRVAESVDKTMSVFRTRSERDRGPFCTLCHLDAWFNNMLFRYSADQKPLEVLLLDFQFIGYAHPGNDLAYFLVTSTAYEFRKKNLNALLSIYHSQLMSVTAACDVDLSFYSLDDVRADFNEGLTVSLWFGTFLLPTMLADSEDSSDFDKLDHTNEQAMDEFQEQDAIRLRKVLGSNEELRSRLRGMFEDLIELGAI